MSDVIHATARAIRGDGPSFVDLFQLQIACESYPISVGYTPIDFFSANDLRMLVNGEKPHCMPTCEKCLVLLDEVLQRKP